MGASIVKPDSKKIYLLGNSGDYQIGPNRDHLKLVQELYPEWTLSMA
jgi:hypothetical protein